MAAHDSILSARVKQTRDANRKRRDAPFKTGELVYLASKHISFAKGLARKLIPKFVGPYKILQDFENSSFKLELPAHLKKRGVHDVFHSSLLREHIPNDDRLFPGRMDTQVGNTPETEGEWAVDRILSHAGSGTNSVFEIQWKSGDITWMPYYQITYLQALTDYLDLFGISKVEKLPKGTGKPPQDDAQVFFGAVSSMHSPIPFSTLPLTHLLKNHFVFFSHNIKSLVSAAFKPSFKFITPTIDLEFPMPPKQRTALQSVDHPLFSRLSPTTYLMRDPDYTIGNTIHTGQVALYLQFDEQLRRNRDPTSLRSIPSGYMTFSDTWNDGIAPGDARRMSTIYLSDDPQDYYVTPSTHPITLRDFYITPAQTGSVVNQPFNDTGRTEVINEYAVMMAARQKKQRQSFEERQQKRLQTFGTSAPVFSKYSHFGRQARNKHSKKKDSPYSSPTSTQGSTTESPPVPYTEPLPVPEDIEIPEDPGNASLPTEQTHTSVPMEGAFE